MAMAEKKREANEETVEQVSRLPYAAPTLVRIGSVRELTLSGGNTVTDQGSQLAQNGLPS
jgi:hypothetical protein